MLQTIERRPTGHSLIIAPDTPDGNILNYLSQNPLASLLVNAIPDIMLILNDQREIIFANEIFYRDTGLKPSDLKQRLRPGQAFRCAYANEGEGCGTAEFCTACGAAKAIRSSLRGVEAVEVCRISRVDGHSLDLQVWTTPFMNDGQRYTILSIKDISHENRRQALERIFFHDILNTAGTLQGFINLIISEPATEQTEMMGYLQRLSERLLEEIRTQRDLSYAENGELQPNLLPISANHFMLELASAYRAHPVAEGKQLVVHTTEADIEMVTDPVLLQRVISNMLKNALEASEASDTVTMSWHIDEGVVEFTVHNPAYMPRSVQLQVFQRSFSTKGSGRGLGTYSMRLLTECYLQGSVSFTSTREAGTHFFLRLPLKVMV